MRVTPVKSPPGWTEVTLVNDRRDVLAVLPEMDSVKVASMLRIVNVTYVATTPSLSLVITPLCGLGGEINLSGHLCNSDGKMS